MEETYKAIEIDKYGGPLQVRERKFRPIGKDELLIKVACTTIHPSDLMFLLGQYGDNKPYKFPIVPGFEGSGEIVKVGDSIDKSLIGKRVSVTGPFNKDGTYFGLWAEFHYTKRANIVVFDKDIDFEKIAFSFINPLTACGFIDTIKKQGSKAIVQNGAAGAFGKMLAKLCEKEGIKTINLVRRKEQMEELNSNGISNSINTSDKDWNKSLFKLAKELNANIFFDCVGGSMAGKVLYSLPNGSIMYNFGNLEVKPIGIDSISLIFKDKKVFGWWLMNWLKLITPEERKYWYGYIAKEIESGSDLFSTKVSERFDLKEIEKAIGYYEKNMSKGKVILRPKF
jgi:NADPH2:quinone reductase